jgi:hypothetical protein
MSRIGSHKFQQITGGYCCWCGTQWLLRMSCHMLQDRIKLPMTRFLQSEERGCAKVNMCFQGTARSFCLTNESRSNL